MIPYYTPVLYLQTITPLTGVDHLAPSLAESTSPLLSRSHSGEASVAHRGVFASQKMIAKWPKGWDAETNNLVYNMFMMHILSEPMYPNMYPHVF